MSVIHEAVKRARGEKSPQRPALTKKSPEFKPSVLVWVLLFFLIAEAALCWREHNLRLHSEEKMHQAYLQLNDSRGEYLEKSDTVRRSASELRELRAKLSQVESDNLEKEKKLSGLTKEIHQTEMEKFRLEDQIKTLKKSAEAVLPSSK